MFLTPFSSSPKCIVSVCLAECQNCEDSGRDLKARRILQEEDLDVSEVAGAIIAGSEAEVPRLSAAADGASTFSDYSLANASAIGKSIEKLACSTTPDGSSSPRKILQLREKVEGKADSSNIVHPKEPKPAPPPILPPNNLEIRSRPESPRNSHLSSFNVDALPCYPKNRSSIINGTANDILGEDFGTGESNEELFSTPSEKDVSFVFPEGLGKETLKKLKDVIDNFSEDNIDVYTQNTFIELIRERKNVSLPYFVAVLNINADGEVPLIVDGISFLRDYFRWGRATHPTTRRPITSFMIFKNSNKKNVFKLFCSHATIRIDNDHFAKWINACDPDLNSALRGRERFYLACHYMNLAEDCTNSLAELETEDPTTHEKRKFYLLKNKFWLMKAAEDGYLVAYLNLAYISLADAEEDRKALNTALIYLRSVVDKVSNCSPKSEGILKACLQIFMEFPEICADDIDRVNALLNSRSQPLLEKIEGATAHQYLFDHQ